MPVHYSDNLARLRAWTSILPRYRKYALHSVVQNSPLTTQTRRLQLSLESCVCASV